MLIELGGGTNPHPRADIVIDLHHPRLAPPWDATVTPWAIEAVGGRPIGGRLHDVPPFITLGDEVLDEVYASHFMEHIPKGQPLLNVMNEAWRVLRPGGTFTMLMPLVGYTNPFTGEPMSNHIGWQPWADPTHVSYWWLPEALMYFCEGPFKPCANYGMQVWGPLGAFRPESDWSPFVVGHDSFWTVRSGWEGLARLVKP